MADEIDYKQAAKELFIEAKRGDAESQCLLGQMYYEGLGVKQDYKKAATWLQKAAKQGNTEAKDILETLNIQDAAVSKAILISTASSTSDVIISSEKPKNSSLVKKIGLIAASVLILVTFASAGFLFFYQDSTMNVSGVVAKVIPATVFISVEKEKGGGTGSGFFAQGGKIFTNAHVIEDAKKITIKAHNGKAYNAEVLDVNKDLDFAVLTASVPPIEYSNLEFTSDIPTPGSEIVVIGSPLGYEQTVSNGLISAIRHYDNDLTLLQISAPISPGSSGSPVVNMKGQVVGLATMTLTQGQNLNFAISHTSVNRKFSHKDTYLVQSGVPIVMVMEDSKTGLLRVNGSKPANMSESPKGDHVRILGTERQEVRLLTKVQSEQDGKVYWIDSNYVKQPMNMTFDEFLERFNDGLSSSERLSRSDFALKDNVMTCKNGNHSLYITLDSKKNIKKVEAKALRQGETPAALHSWIQQTVKVFYPNSLIARSFFIQLIGMALESVTISNFLPGYHAQVEKFPVLFDMASSVSDCTLTAFVNDPDAHKQDLSKLVKDTLSSTSMASETTKTLPQYENALVIPKPKPQAPKNPNIPGIKFVGKDDGYEMYLVTDSIEYDRQSQLTSFLTLWWPTEKSKIQMRQDPYFYIPHGKDLGVCILQYVVDFKTNKYIHLRTINYCTDGETIARDYIQPDEKLIWRTPKTGSRIKLLMQEVKKARGR